MLRTTEDAPVRRRYRCFVSRHGLLLVAACFLAACEGSGGGATDAVDDDTAAGPAPACVDSIPRTQPASAPCCVAHGVDACGAGLFCAAFDGRTQATCYAERSRADQTECGDDSHCVSGACHPDLQRCRSFPESSCDPAVGCAAGPGGQTYACVGDENPTCKPSGEADLAEPCETSGDCRYGLSCEDWDWSERRCTLSCYETWECRDPATDLCVVHAGDYRAVVCVTRCHRDQGGCGADLECRELNALDERPWGCVPPR